jgi:hypothetical protein
MKIKYRYLSTLICLVSQANIKMQSQMHLPKISIGIFFIQLDNLNRSSNPSQLNWSIASYAAELYKLGFSSSKFLL